MAKRQNEMSSSSKNDEYLILGRNSDFREKFGILELEMSHPGYTVSKSGNGTHTQTENRHTGRQGATFRAREFRSFPENPNFDLK